MGVGLASLFPLLGCPQVLLAGTEMRASRFAVGDAGESVGECDEHAAGAREEPCSNLEFGMCVAAFFWSQKMHRFVTTIL